MRKKALLAGAGSSFEGPWVNLEPGEWLVEPSKDVELAFVGKGEEIKLARVKQDNKGRKEVIFPGPIRIRAIVSPDYSGPGIFLAANQISTNGDVK